MQGDPSVSSGPGVLGTGDALRSGHIPEVIHIDVVLDRVLLGRVEAVFDAVAAEPSLHQDQLLGSQLVRSHRDPAVILDREGPGPLVSSFPDVLPVQQFLRPAHRHTAAKRLAGDLSRQLSSGLFLGRDGAVRYPGQLNVEVLVRTDVAADIDVVARQVRGGIEQLTEVAATQDAQFQILRRYAVAQPVELGTGQRHTLRAPQRLDRARNLFRVVRVPRGGFAPVNHRFPYRVSGSPVAAPGSLDDGRPRRGLGDEGAGVDVHPGLDRLGGDDDPSVARNPAQLLELGLAFHPTKLGVNQQSGLVRGQCADLPVGVNSGINRVHHHQGEGPGFVAVDDLGGELLRFVDRGKFPDRSFCRHAPEQLRGLRRLVYPQHVGAFPGVVDGVQDAFVDGG